MYYYFIGFVLFVFCILHVMDRFSTETLLGIEQRYQQDLYIRTKLDEHRRTRNILNLEKNRLARYLMQKFGVHNGLWIMTLCVFVPMVTLFIATIYARSEYSVADELIIVVLAFMAGILTHQTGNAMSARKVLKKIEKERDAI